MASPKDKQCKCGNLMHRDSIRCVICAKKNWKEIMKEKNIIYHPRKSPILEKNCLQCGKIFTNARKTIPSSGNLTICPSQFSKMITCSRKCKEEYCVTHKLKAGKNSGGWKGGITFDKKYYTFMRLKGVAQKSGNGGSHTLVEWETLKMKYRYMCLCCKRCEPEIFLTQDHIMPISKGGNDNIENIQPLCFSCNSRKHTKNTNFIKLYESTTS